MTFAVANPRARPAAAAAVIADARRRQLRRRASFGAGVLSAAVLALFAFHAPPFGGRGSVSATVRLYLQPGVTVAQAHRVVAAARGERGVVGVTVVSREAALAMMKRRYPQLVKNLTSNPLSARIDVRLGSTEDARRLVSDLRTARLLPIVHLQYVPHA
ncbi:MAG: permease-like cell division protein FtsX [Gaiellaceae bacterium]